MFSRPPKFPSLWSAHHEPEHAMKLRSTSIRIVAALAFVLLLLVALPAGPASAAVTPLQGWANLYSGAAYPGTISPGPIIAVGSERLLVVAISSSQGSVVAQTVSVTYGDTALTLAVGDAGVLSQAHTYLFYLKDTPAVMNGAAHNLVVTITGGTSNYNFVYATVYAGVNQLGIPYTSMQNFNSGTTESASVGPFTTPLTIASGDQAVEIINLTRANGNAEPMRTWAPGWSGPTTNSNGVYEAYIALDGTAGNTDSGHTAQNKNYINSMSAMNLKAFVATPTMCLPYTDYYESDDLISRANLLPTDGTRQNHLNMPANLPTPDVDWFKFVAVAGHSYDIRTQLLNDIDMYGNAANDTLLYLYASDGVTQLGFNDDVNYATWYMGYYYYRESIISWTAPAAGTYYVQELQWGPTAGNTINDCHAYQIWVQDNAPSTPTFTPTATMTLTPTFTPTLTRTLTPTFTITHTPMPLAGATFVQYSAMLLNAPDFGLNAQTVSGRISGGVRPYTVVVHIISPDKTVGNNGDLTFTPPVQPDDTFVLNAAITGNAYFGCDYEGIWLAWFLISDSAGHTNVKSASITWAVSFPRVHAIP
jgi:hypothetical protein